MDVLSHKGIMQHRATTFLWPNGKEERGFCSSSCSSSDSSLPHQFRSSYQSVTWCSYPHVDVTESQFIFLQICCSPLNQCLSKGICIYLHWITGLGIIYSAKILFFFLYFALKLLTTCCIYGISLLTFCLLFVTHCV